MDDVVGHWPTHLADPPAGAGQWLTPGPPGSRHSARMRVVWKRVLPHDHAMTSPATFRDETNWSGGYYELAMEVGSTDDARLQAVLSALWAAADVHGCFGRADREPEDQDPVPCTVASLTEFGHLRGQVRLPTGQLVVCGSVAIRGGDESSDWLDFYVPTGALEQAGLAYQDGRPFFGSDVMDEWLAAIGTKTFESASFSLGIIGFEVSGCTDASTPAGDLPRTRDMGYLLPQGGVLRHGAANT